MCKLPGAQGATKIVKDLTACSKRVFWACLQVLETVLELLLTEEGQLDPAYCCLQPLEQRRQNVLHMLGAHLAHPSNAGLAAPLLARAARVGPPAVRLLRTLCARLFRGDKYLQQRRIARGAYAEVMLALTVCLHLKLPWTCCKGGCLCLSSRADLLQCP